MLDPVIIAYGRGQLRDFPTDPGAAIDVVPVDLIVNATLAAAATLLRTGGLSVCHVATGEIPLAVGESWSREKYRLPYLRDLLMDYGVMADVAETATVWSNVLPLYRAARQALEDRLRADGKAFYVGCHLAHTYQTGCSLYFTFAAATTAGRELEEYYRYKRAVTEAFVTHGGRLSHHHAVGLEHLDWMAHEVTPTGVRALQGLKAALDPKGIMNPGKLIPAHEMQSRAAAPAPGERKPRRYPTARVARP